MSSGEGPIGAAKGKWRGGGGGGGESNCEILGGKYGKIADLNPAPVPIVRFCFSHDGHFGFGGGGAPLCGKKGKRRPAHPR